MALAAQQTELLRLRELLDARPDALPESLADLEFEAPESASRLRAVPARVLHRDVSRTRRAFLVDTGEERGVYRGLAVAYGNCLVGVVRTTARDGAQVVRIDDPARDNVYPAVVRPRDGAAEGRPAGFLAGVARGAGDGHVIVSHLGEGAARVGDLVVTGAGRFGIPEGLVMGEVVRFDDDDRDGIWEARVRPLRDLDTLVSVLIYVRPPLDPALRSRRR